MPERGLYWRGDSLEKLEAELPRVERELKQARADNRRCNSNGAWVSNREIRLKFLKSERRRLRSEQGAESVPLVATPSTQMELL